MPDPRRMVVARFAVAAISLLVAVATGMNWIGQPFRAVELVTLLGLGAMAGVAWMQAVAGAKEHTRAPWRMPDEGSRPDRGA